MSTVDEHPGIQLSSDAWDAPVDRPSEPLSDERLGEIVTSLGDLPALQMWRFAPCA